MSFREKSAWISFVSILIVFAAYFWNVYRIVGHRVEHDTGFKVSAGLLIAFVVLQVVLRVAIRLQAPSEARKPRDEREQLIEMRATRVAFPVLVVGALAGVGMMHLTRSAFMVAQYVLLAIVVAELVKFGGEILYYRQDS